MCSTSVLSIRSVAFTKKDKSVRKINAGIPEGCGGDLIMKHFSFDWFKGAVTDIRYFASSKFSWSLVHKKNFGLIWQVVFKLGYVLFQKR